jgi:hypothetical protein
MIRSLRKAASRTADKAAWSHFIKHYAKAFRTALTAARKRNQ